MSDTPTIEPALMPEEWVQERPALEGARKHRWHDITQSIRGYVEDGLFEGAIALLNDLLPDDDPRKITRARLALLRDTADFQRQSYPASWDAHREAVAAIGFIDALESYLPPE